MAMTRIWNVTDDPNTNVKAQNLVVMGRVLRPGKSVQVEEGRLEKAHKVHKDVSSKFLFVGKTAPRYLVKASKPVLKGVVSRSQLQLEPIPVKVEGRAEASVEKKEPSTPEAPIEGSVDESGQEAVLDEKGPEEGKPEEFSRKKGHKRW